MKIAYVCNEYPPRRHGGIGRFVHTIAHAMKDAGHDVTVVGLGETSEQRDDSGVRVVTLQYRRLRGASWVWNRCRLRQWLTQQVSRGRIEIIETPEYGGMLAFPFRACPVVVRLHQAAKTIADTTGEAIPTTVCWCEHCTLKFHRDWIAVSQHILDLTQRAFSIKPRRAEVVFNPIRLAAAPSLEALPPIPEPFVLYAGAVAGRKNAYLLAEAARPFLAACPDLRLVLAGRVGEENGEGVDRTMQRIVGPELADRLHFLGFVEQSALTALMRRATAFVFPSTVESFGLVVAEAMLAGTAVLVPDVPPFTEFIIDGENGLLTRAGDPGALASAVTRLVRNPDVRAKVAVSGREAARRLFSVDVCVTRTLAFYQHLLR